MLSKISGITAIYEATNTTEALKIFRESAPDVVILDISIPPTSGIHVLEIMKEEKPKVKVIILTNYPSDQFKTVCKSLGADFFFVKSEDFFEIPRVLKNLIKKSQQK